MPSSSSASTTCIKSRATKAVPISSPVALDFRRQALAFSSARAQSRPRATSEELPSIVSVSARVESKSLLKQVNGMVFPVPLCVVSKYDTG